MDSGGSTFYFAYDGLGSVVNLTNSSGATQWTYAYLPYGGVRTETKNATQAPANVLRFAGQVLDPTALYQLRARSYDPTTGRLTRPTRSQPGPSIPTSVPISTPTATRYGSWIRLGGASGRSVAQIRAGESCRPRRAPWL
jgi:RHS repeat-associated protein